MGQQAVLGKEFLISEVLGLEKTQVKCEILFIIHSCPIYTAIPCLIIYPKEVKLRTKI